MSDHHAVIKHWDTPKVVSFEEIKPNKVFIITFADDAIYALKCSDAGDELSQKRLGFRHDVLAHLTRVDVPVEEPIQTRQGTTYVTQANKVYVLSKHIDNEIPWPPATAERSFNIGLAIAKLHEALLGCQTENLGFKIHVNRLGHDMYEKSLPHCRAHLTGQDLDLVERVAKSTPSDIIPNIEKLETQLIHRDLHGGNILVKGTEVVGFIDFEILSIGPRIYDLAYFGVQNIRYAVIPPEPRIENWCQVMEGIFSGYAKTTKAPITDKERQLLPHFMQEAALMFVTMRSKKAQHLGGCSFTTTNSVPKAIWHVHRVTNKSSALQMMLF